MEGYSFYEGNPPSEDQFHFEPSLYNLPGHRLLQNATGWLSYFAINDHDRRVVAAIHFHLLDGVARSPYRSPFGSLEFQPSLPPDVLYEFIRFFEIRLRSKGAKSIVIKSRPEAYDHEQAVLLSTFLLNQQYTVVQSELSSIIHVNGSQPEDHFHHSEKKRLARALACGLQFCLLDLEAFDRVYDFIQSCRQEKQYALSMALPDLKKIIQLFPERIKLFAVLHQDALAAASISIHVRQDVLYDFYHDHTARFDNVSPVVMLVAGIYNYCQQQHIQRIDLGTSTTNTMQPNFGLLRFKMNLGASLTPKMTFEKLLS